MSRPDGILSIDGFRDHPLTNSALESTAWNAFSFYYFGIPFHFPRAQILRRHLLRPEILQKIREKGFDSVYGELREQFGRSARFDIAWGAARNAYYGYVLAQLVAMLWQNQDELGLALDPRTWIFFYGWGQATDEDLLKKQEEDFKKAGGANKVRVEQFISFRDGYADTEENGRYRDFDLPNPWESDYEERLKRCPVSYQEEARNTWRNLVESSDEDLKAQFFENPK